jgi:hypothetical protein
MSFPVCRSKPAKSGTRGSNPPVPLVSLLDRCDLQNRSIVTIVFKKHGVPARDMHTIPAIIQLFKIANRGPTTLKTKNVLANNPPILFI